MEGILIVMALELDLAAIGGGFGAGFGGCGDGSQVQWDL